MKRVLLVEDDKDSRAVYRLILEHGGYEVLEAHDGAEAIHLCRDLRPDLILMDISIPVVDGWEATRVLKADESTEHIPVIALTAHSLAQDHARAEEIGFDAYLTKPTEPHCVLEEVNRLLARSSSDPIQAFRGTSEDAC